MTSTRELLETFGRSYSSDRKCATEWAVNIEAELRSFNARLKALEDHLKVTAIPAPTDEELDEFAIFWFGPELDVEDYIEKGYMALFARAVLERWGKPALGEDE